LAAARAWLAAGLAWALGVGAASQVAWLWLASAGPTRPGALVVADVVAIVVVATTLALVSRRSQPPSPALPPFGGEGARLRRLLIATFALVVPIAVFTLAWHSQRKPHGMWDAIMIWNARARFLFRAGEDWRVAFDPRIVHADYPLLVPLSVLRAWLAVGRETTIAPAVIGSLFTAATAVVLVSSLWRRRGSTVALLAGTVFLGTEFVTRHGASQCADTPLGLYLLGSVVALDLEPGEARFPRALAGALAGLARRGRRTRGSSSSSGCSRRSRSRRSHAAGGARPLASSAPCCSARSPRSP
jgi:hypothetical protein